MWRDYRYGSAMIEASGTGKYYRARADDDTLVPGQRVSFIPGAADPAYGRLALEVMILTAAQPIVRNDPQTRLNSLPRETIRAWIEAAQTSRAELKERTGCDLPANYVYVLEGTGISWLKKEPDLRSYKIGQSGNPERRRRETVRKYRTPITIVHTIHPSDSYALEAALHCLFAPKQAETIVSPEWFLLNEEDLTWLRRFVYVDVNRLIQAAIQAEGEDIAALLCNKPWLSRRLWNKGCQG